MKHKTRKSHFRFPLLNDKEWLIEHYEKKGLSALEVAEIIGCTKDGVRVALVRNGIQLRTATETNALKYKRNGFRSKYKQLTDKEWLQQKYEVDKLTLDEIGAIVGAKNQNSVRQALLYYGIPLRTGLQCLFRYRNPHSLNGDGFSIDDSVITGCLLGDAGLRCYNKSSNLSYPCFCKKNKFYDHVLYVGKLLFGEHAENRIKETSSNIGLQKFPCFFLSSYVHEELMPYWTKWYPEENNYVKVVPRDIDLTPTALLHWFMDDGSASYRKRNYPSNWTQRKTQVKLTLCSESFTFEDQQFLCDLINSSYHLKAAVKKSNSGGTGFRIGIGQSKVKDFFDLMGPCPVPSMAYKWKIP